MNKRIPALMLALVMSFTLLAGCGSSAETPDTPSENPEVQEPSFGADLTQFYNDIMAAAEEGPMMMDLSAEAEMLESMYPGLTAVETKQLVVAAPAMSAVAVEFAFVEVADAADVETVKAILQERIDAQVNGGAFYPETIEQWQNHSEIVVIDNYVCLFVTADKDALIEAFRSGSEIPAWAKAPETEGEIEGGDVGIMDMPVEDGPAAFDPEAETSQAPAAEPSEQPVERPITPSVEPSGKPAQEPKPEPTPAPSQPAAASIDLAAFYNDLHTALYPLDAEGYSTGPFVDDIAVMPEMLEMYYPGMTAIETKQCHVYFPMMSAVAYEVMLVEVSNAADVDAVKAIMQARIDAQVNGGAFYPETIEGWKNSSRIVTNGNFVMMVAASDFQAYIDAFNALF